MYKLPITLTGWEVNSVIRLEDNVSIPFALDNTDYQAYLKWVALGNTPQPADEVTK
jgi:hypothetical protein